MNNVTFERYLQRVKMALSRDLEVQGVLHVGPVLRPARNADIRDVDFLVVTRSDRTAQYLDDLSWLPDAETIVARAAFGGGHAEVLHGDGRLVRLTLRTLDAMPGFSLGPYKVLLDRGGIGRLARTLSTGMRLDVRPELPDQVTAEHVLLLAWSAWLYRQRGEGTLGERLIELALRAGPQVASTDAAFADRLLSLSGLSVNRSAAGIVAVLDDHSTSVPNTDATAGAINLVRSWIGDVPPPPSPAEPAIVDWPDDFASSVPPPYQETADEVEEVPSTGIPPVRPATGPVENAPVEVSRDSGAPAREFVLAQDACPHCGGQLAPAGRLYVKGSLNDIRFLEGMSATIEFKDRVVARPCTVCRRVTLMMDDG